MSKQNKIMKQVNISTFSKQLKKLQKKIIINNLKNNNKLKKIIKQT